MGGGYSKQARERYRVTIKLHSLHHVRLQMRKWCQEAAILHGSTTPSKKMYESTEKEDLSPSNDQSKGESFEATAKVVSAKTDGMQMNKPKTHLQDRDGDVKMQLEMIKDGEDARRISNVICANEGEPAKETLDGTAENSAADNTRQQPQELKGSNANKLQEVITKGEEEDDKDSARHTNQIDGPPSFSVYCVQPSQEIEQEEEESDDCVHVSDDSDEHPAYQKRSSGDSFGSILSISSWCSHEVAETNVKRQRRKKKFAKAIMGVSVAMKKSLIHKAGNRSHSHRTGQRPNHGCC